MAVSVGSYVTLQRGFVFAITFSDLNNSLCRIRDSVELDLRNATSITITSSTTAVQTLVLTMPQPYLTYYTSGTLSAQSTRAGEPNLSGTVSGGVNFPLPTAYLVSGTAPQTLMSLNTTTGKISSTGTMTVTYLSSTPPSTDTSAYDPTNPTKQIIIRTGTWTNPIGSGTRTVATFTNNATSISYQIGTSGSDGTVTFTNASNRFVSGSVTLTGSDTALRMLISGTTTDKKRPISSGTLQDTVYLRAHNLQ